MKQPRLIVFVLLQLVLLAIELATDYDTTRRQLALGLTNVVAVLGVLVFERWLRRRGGRLSITTLLMVAGAVWIDALGNFQHLYAGFWWWDRLTHVTGGMAVSAFFTDLFLARRTVSQTTLSWRHAVGDGFLLGQFVSAMYEVSEWLGDWWFKTERVRGLFDAPRDLFFNLVGGLLVVIFFWRSKGR
ncbi:MAG: hypothetical protein HYY50_01955 [Candidatus Kerfeldbacteria bacterium]|nr:hypothetical protein [Candidatus Kerfeldbacteria bacterium]